MPDPTFFELLNACGQPGCPICRIVRASTEHYLESLFYEQVNDIRLRAQLRQSLGFCGEHAHLALEPGLGDALGVAIIYHDVLGSVLKNLPASQPATRNGFSAVLGQIPRQLSTAIKAASAALAPQAPCPACQERDSTTGLVLAALLENLQDEALANALAGSAGLCFPHLIQALDRVRNEQDFNALLDLHKEKYQALRDELAELIRKNDYRFREEGFGSERDAWRRVIGQVTGGRTVKPD